MFDWLFGWISKPEYQWTFVEDRLPQIILAIIIAGIIVCIGILVAAIKSGRNR